MFFTKVFSRPLAPGPHKVIIESAANKGAGNRNQPPRPLLHHFLARLHRNSAYESWYQPVDHFFFQQLAANVHAGGAGGGHPELSYFVVSVVFEPVHQAEFLYGTEGDGGENAQVREHGKNSAEAEAGALNRRDSHPAANGLLGYIVNQRKIHRVHTLEVGNG